MMQLDSPEVQKSMEKIFNWNLKTAFYKIAENDCLKSTFVWTVLPLSTMPLDNGAILEHLHILQLLNSCLGHSIFLPSRGEIRSFVDIRLGFILLGSHLNVTSENLCSGTTREANGKQTE